MQNPLRKSIGSLAAITALATPAISHAQVVASSATAHNLKSDFTIDINGDGSQDVQFSFNSGYSYLAGLNGTTLAESSGYIALFSQGATINSLHITASNTFISSEPYSSPFDGQTGYVGASFLVGSDSFNAWLEFDFNQDINGNTRGSVYNGHFVSAAWESTPGASIEAGATAAAIPEPAHIAAGLGLVAGIASWLRRRKQR